MKRQKKRPYPSPGPSKIGPAGAVARHRAGVKSEKPKIIYGKS